MKKLFSRILIGTVLTAASTSVFAAQIPLLKIQDSVNVSMRDRIERALAIAKSTEASAIFIELDTPGGYLEVTRQIVKIFLASETPIIVYVSPSGAHAASAGAMITMAAHFAAMAPSTSIGASTPVSGSGEEIGEDLRKKITNDTAAFVEGIAEQRGRDKTFARESVTLAASLNATDAHKKNVIDGVFSSRDEVWRAARVKYPKLPESPNFEIVEMSLKEKSLSLLSNPNVTYLLMALGTLGIYMEISNPGLVVPGLVGVASLALSTLSLQIIPFQTSALILLALGLILLIVEVFTPLPTFGLAGAASLVLIFLSGVFLMDESSSTLHLDPGIWLPAFAVLCAAVGLLSYYSFRALKSNPHLVQGARGMIGLEAHVTRIHQDSVSLSVIGEIWTGIPAAGLSLAECAVGDTVKIIAQEGLKVFFTKNEKKES